MSKPRNKTSRAILAELDKDPDLKLSEIMERTGASKPTAIKYRRQFLAGDDTEEEEEDEVEDEDDEEVDQKKTRGERLQKVLKPDRNPKSTPKPDEKTDEAEAADKVRYWEV